MSSLLQFTDAETDLLGRTADALSAYMGKPVLAEIIHEPDEDFEWALFAVPLAPGEDSDDRAVVQVGGPGARFLGNLGGLTLEDEQPLECEFLWAIQLSSLEGVRFIKVDSEGDEVAWTNSLDEILPFDLHEAIDDEDEDDEDTEDEVGAE
ncbi:MAG TPA: hypothetical protein VL024_03215, partial [Castellaniella sp.]|nr:hypothetical protein [Castellaniella sp.]